MLRRLRQLLLVLLAAPVAPYTPPTRHFATFGNAQTKDLIKAWAPQPVGAAEGSVLLPSSTETMKRCAACRAHGDTIAAVTLSPRARAPPAALSLAPLGAGLCGPACCWRTLRQGVSRRSTAGFA